MQSGNRNDVVSGPDAAPPASKAIAVNTLGVLYVNKTAIK